MNNDADSLIPNACPKQWSELGADEQLQTGGLKTTARHCSQCDHHVHDISDLSRVEVLSLKAELGGKLCGVICGQNTKKPVNLSGFSKPLMIGTSIAGLALASCTPQSTTPDRRPMILGKVAPSQKEAAKPVAFPGYKKLEPQHQARKFDMVIGIVALEE